MSFLKRNHPPVNDDTDEENDDTIDPELRLRTVRTAASAIAESIISEQRAQRRKSKRAKGSRFFRSRAEKKAEAALPVEVPPSKVVPGERRNVYVNYPLSAMEVDHDGQPKVRYVRNKVRTTSERTFIVPVANVRLTRLNRFKEYTIFTFIPKNLYEQFRRYGFLTLSFVMKLMTSSA